MKLGGRVIAVLVSAVVFAGNALSQPVFPLKIGQSGRYFVDQNEVPFFIHGDTPWSLIGQVSREDAELYIQDAASRGFNSIIVTLVEGYYADNAPANFYGVVPFTTPNDFTTPNEPYFEHADWVINKAAEYGLQVVLAPNYLGCCNDGWANALRDDNSEADATWFGEWVGRRYRNFPNLMYAWGNDLDPADLRAKIRAMAQGVKATDPNHLQTYHAWQKSALDAWDASESWLDFNITYTYEPVQIDSLEDFNRSPFLPYFLFESHYENDFGGMGAARTRQQAYTALLSGAAGHHYGNNPIWHMNGNPADGSTNWKNHLDDEGRADMQHVRRLFESREWFTLVPDQAHLLVTSGIGSGDSFVAAALSEDSATAIIYFPRRTTISVDLGQISGPSKTGWWFNPRDGSAAEIGTLGGSGSMSFTPPSGNDWALVIDDSSRGFGAPGEEAAVVRPNPPENLRIE
jgi:hypothetical protein